MAHEDLYNKAEEAIKDVYSDTSVLKEETRISLQTLISEIEILLDALGH